MVIVEKPWEIKNLGLSSVEYIINPKDAFNDIDFAEIERSDFDYKICRLHATQMDIAYKLQNMGFQFAETTVALECRLKDHFIAPVYEKYVEMVDVKEADRNDLDYIVEEIKLGMYDNDRVALDPNLGVERSRTRFSNWLQQEYVSGVTKICLLYMKNEPFGYFAVKSLSEKEASSIQAGLFHNFRDSGMGFATLLFPMLVAKQDGKRKITTEVSSNNVISVKTHLSVGYHVTDLKYVLVRHDHLRTM